MDRVLFFKGNLISDNNFYCTVKGTSWIQSLLGQAAAGWQLQLGPGAKARATAWLGGDWSYPVLSALGRSWSHNRG